MFNQTELASHDMHIWRDQRTMLHNRVRAWCNKNNFNFTADPDTVATISHKNKIVYMWLCDLLHPMEYWNNKNTQLKKLGATMFVFTDNFIEFDDLEFVKFHSDPTLHAIYGSYQDTVTVNHNPSKLYNCFIQRVESVRQSWFYFLYLKGLLEKGYVSFLLRQLSDYSKLTGVELFDYIHQTHQLGQLEPFQQAYCELRSQVPYKNFAELLDLTPYIQDSKYSLVLETYATNPATDCWLIGEKAIRAICFPSTPLLFMQARAVEKLRSIGFWIDHHDEIDVVSWTQRQQLLLEILEKDSVAFDSQMLYNRSMHNREVCAQLQHQFHQDNYFDEFFTQVLEH